MKTTSLMRVTALTLHLLAMLLAASGALTAAETKPSAGFDLSHWKLTLPVSASGTAGGHPMEISASQLSAGYTHADYFRRGADGQMIFIKLQDGLLSVTVNGGTQTVNVFEKDSDWARQTLYFKLGAYTQDNEGPASEGARVSFSRFKVIHAEAKKPRRERMSDR